MIRRPPRSTQSRSSAASDVYKRQDVTYLKENRSKVRAFLITHAHEDHVGGLPYVLPEFPGIPVYASTLARGLLGNKIKEHRLHNNPLIGLEPGDEIPIGPFTVVPFRIGHSIPDAMGIALRTPVGTVCLLYTSTSPR